VLSAPRDFREAPGSNLRSVHIVRLRRLRRTIPHGWSVLEARHFMYTFDQGLS
jgi:hypothetical protein